MLKRHTNRVVFATFIVLSFSLFSAAQAEAPWYQFEVIIFERINKGAGSTESWSLDPGTPSRLDARPMRLRPAKAGGQDGAYKTLPKSAWRLMEVEQRLRRSRNYRPHVHLAWRQPVGRPDQAQKLHLEMYDRKDAKYPVEGLPKLEGTLKVGVKRYLHFEVDLLLRRLRAQDAAAAESADEPWSGGLRSFRLQTSRRMRSGKLHYLDHPVFGVLVLANRYTPAKAEPEVRQETPISAEIPPLVDQTDGASSATQAEPAE